MPSKEKKEEVKEVVTVESLKAQLDDACAKIRRHSENWVRHMKTYHAEGDGKVGKASIATMLISAFVTVLVGVGIIFAETIDDKSAGTGTYTLSQASVGTGDITLTVDELVADFTGDITTDDINASGANTATLDFNMGSATNVTTATITYKVTNRDVTLVDGNKLVVVGLNGYNTGGEVPTTVNYVTHEYVMSDVTSSTEDGSYVIKIMKAGADTTVSTLNASGLAIVGAVDADNLTVNAGAGLDNAAAGALLLGAATATSVEIADSGVATDIQGDVTILGDIDTAGASTMTIGSDAATRVEIADAGVITDVEGVLDVAGVQTNQDAVVMKTTLNVTGITTCSSNLDVSVNATVGGTLEVTGAMTGSSTLDVDSITVDAGAGIDNQAAGALLIGASTATSVEIADSGVATDIQGDVTILGDIDTAGASTMTVGSDAATRVEIADSGVITDIEGPLDVAEVQTNQAAVTMLSTLGVTGLSTLTGGSTVNAFRTLVPEERASGLADAITPTNSLIFLTASANTTNTVVAPVLAGAAVGTELKFVNVGTPTIDFEDGTTLELSATVTLGQWDTLSLIACTTGTWVQVSVSDN